MLTSNHIYRQPTEISIFKQPSFFFFKEQATQLVGASNQQNPQSINFSIIQHQTLHIQ